MSQIRLFGLVLFVTSVFLAMAAAVTQTTHIRFKKREQVATTPLGNEAAQTVGTTDEASGLQFVAVPVLYPLVIAGGVGMLMWFVPAPRATATRGGSSTARKRRRRRLK